jgi:hypothetical protein
VQIDLVDVTTKLLALAILLLAVACIVMIWMAAVGQPVFHIPWVEVHHAE